MRRSSILFNLLSAAGLVGLLSGCDSGGTTSGSAAANTAPVIKSAPALTGTQGTAYSYNVTATDANGDTLTYRLVPTPVAPNLVEPVPFGMTIDPASGVISWTPAAQTGDNLVTVQVTDGSLAASQSFIVKVVVAVPPAAPVFIAPPALPTAFENSAYSTTVIAADANGDTLTYSLVPTPVAPNLVVPVPAGMTIVPGTGVISWIPAAGQVGPNVVTVQAQDSSSSSLATSQNFTISVEPATAASGVIFGFDDLTRGGFNVTQPGIWTLSGPDAFSTLSGSAIIARRDLEVEIHNGRPRFIQPEFIFFGVTLINRGTTDVTFAVIGYNDSHGVTTFSYSVTVIVGDTFIVRNSFPDNIGRPMNVPIERLEVNGVSLPLPTPEFGVSCFSVGTSGSAPACP
jgi:Putative Ig domain